MNQTFVLLFIGLALPLAGQQDPEQPAYLGVDRHGVPLLCGSLGAPVRNQPATLASSPNGAVIPESTRMWESVPGVIFNDGIDSFRLEVTVTAAVNGINLLLWPSLVSESGRTDLPLRDDGLGGDRAARDFIYTSERLRYNKNSPLPLHRYYGDDTNSPAGLSVEDVGNVVMTETDGSQTHFAIYPEFGLLSTNIPLTQTVVLSSNVVVAPHLINVQNASLTAQKFLRQLGADLGAATLSAYAVLPDAFDFVICFSAYHLERVPANAYENGNAGIHWPVQVNFSGTGQPFYNYGLGMGSSGRLLGFSCLEAYQRGIASQNCAHEILHQWGSYISGLAINNYPHYNDWSSVASLLGGNLWIANSNNTWTLNCDEGRNRGTRVSPLDKYMMGLLSSNELPVFRTYPQTEPGPLYICYFSNSIIRTVESTVTIADIIARFGPRIPGPETAKRDFAIGFIAESNGRLLSPVEMTFYEVLAAHITSSVPEDRPNPRLDWNWAPITRYFGTDTTWTSEVLSLLRPRIVSSAQLTAGRIRIAASGLPSRTYVLQRSTNCVAWADIASQLAGNDGLVTFIDGGSSTASRYYRLRWP